MADSDGGDEDPPSPTRLENCRNGAAFWILGLCNNLPYVVMLSAAHDILQPNQPPPPQNGSGPACSPVSTGAVLLADILPSLLVKMAAPFGAHLVPYSARVVAVAVAAWGGCSAVAIGAGIGVSLGGVALSSASSGLGELTVLALSAECGSWALPCWASGSGAAGLGGAVLYAALTQGALLSPRRALLPLLLLPPAMLGSFFFLLRLPRPPPPEQQPLLEPRPTSVGLSQEERRAVLKVLLRNAAPLSLVYFCEYFINQGLLELLYFPTAGLTHSEQYRWLQLAYQSSVFASRSALSCCRFRRIWVLALLQALTAATFLWAVLSHWLPSFGPAFALVLLEGTIGGGAYANAFCNVAEEAPPPARALAISVSALSDAVGIAAAAVAALGAHRLLCHVT